MKKRKALAIFIAIAMVFCYMPVTAMADTAVDNIVDMPREGFWSTESLKAAVGNGLLKGFEEKNGSYIKANDPLTRAQMATIVNRAFGAQSTTALSGVTDAPSNAWYYKDMQKAVKMGTMKLDTTMRPNDTITRQEAFTILARALKMEDGSMADLREFNDASQVSNWATSGMGAMIKAGYIKGDNNRLNPTASMTRAQFATIMHSVVKQYITSPGTFTKVVPGNVMVNAPGVTLKDLTISGDLIVGDGVGDGTLTLDNVTIKGKKIIRSGSVSTVETIVTPPAVTPPTTATYKVVEVKVDIVWGDILVLSPGFGEDEVEKPLADFDGYVFSNGKDESKFDLAVMKGWLAPGKEIDVRNNVLVAKDKTAYDANIAVAKAKALLGDIVLEQSDKKLLTVLKAIDGIAETGVTLAVKAPVEGVGGYNNEHAKIAINGDVTNGRNYYGDSQDETLRVTITINKNNASKVETEIDVTVPGKYIGSY